MPKQDTQKVAETSKRSAPASSSSSRAMSTDIASGLVDTPDEEAAYASLLRTMRTDDVLEAYISNPRRAGRTAAELRAQDAVSLRRICRVAAKVAAHSQKVRRKEARQRARDADRRCAGRSTLLRVSDTQPPTDEQLYEACRFTDALPLAGYVRQLRFAPTIVNVVSLATVRPTPGFDTVLPLDLVQIATRCSGALYTRRFAAVQLGKMPRARVLVFSGQGRPVHLVAIGASGTTSSLLTLMQARRQLADEAGVYVDIEDYRTINIVGAADLGATINTEALAQANTDTVHYDPASFVGATMRPRNTSGLVIEMYSTGRANCPGARSQCDLLKGFAEALPELLRFSSAERDALQPDAIRGAVADAFGAVGALDTFDTTDVADESVSVPHTRPFLSQDSTILPRPRGTQDSFNSNGFAVDALEDYNTQPACIEDLFRGWGVSKLQL